jgi:outer membrane protein OmpA-like peptidoglycan-associated protein/tetratricopeptide (TPR) repeat protein
MKSLFILSLLISTLGMVYAQSPIKTDTLKPLQIKKLAKNSVRFGDIYAAITYFEEYIKIKPNRYDFKFELADLYRKSRDYTKAESLYMEVYTNASKKFPDAQFYYARMLKANGKYVEAKQEFTKFTSNKEAKKLENIKQLKKMATAEIQGCDAAIELSKTKFGIIVNHLDNTINKAHIELSPIHLDTNTLLYSSINEDNLKLYSLDKEEKQPVRKFYTAQKEKGKWKGGKEFEAPFNDEDANVGNGALSPDGLKFYFSKCAFNGKSKMVCRLMVSNKEKDKWQKPTDLGELVNSEEFTSTMPAIGIDSKKQQELIYFVSDRPGGKGGLDIWYTYYDAKKKIYKAPRNAGPIINTVGDEITPMYDLENRTLYYSSDGLPGLGELDIFQTIGEIKNWSTPENLGTPYNSSSDDLYYFIGKKEGVKNGFFVSNRKGGTNLLNETCCDDIYEFTDPQFIEITVKGSVLELSSDSTNTITGQLKNTPVKLYKIQKDGSEHLIKSTTTNEKGDYDFQLEKGNNYKIIVEKNGYFTKKMEVSTIKSVKPDTVIIDLAVKKIPKEAIVITNIYYETGKAELKPESKASLEKELVKLLNDNPQIIIEIGSHTDDIGSNEYNMKLSQQRAESVVKFLVEKGIPKERMLARGYGESKPLTANITTVERQRNRRTEFKIIGTIKNTEINYEE